MTTIFGKFKDNIPKTHHEYLELGFSPTSLSVQQRWRNNGLSADFIADYLTTFLPVYDANNNDERQLEIKGAINYIANELLENAMKFNYEPSEEPIKFRLHLLQTPTPTTIVMSVSNGISLAGLNELQDFIQEFLNSEPDEFYIRQLEKSASEDVVPGSGMGFITIQNDYQAHLGWKFCPSEHQSENFTVTTMVQLPV